MVKDDEFDLKV